MFDYIFCDKNINNSLISKAVLATYRYGNLIYKIQIPIVKQVLWFVYRLLDFFIINIIANADIPAECNIGKNLYLAHGANGIVIHPNSVIGEYARIYHQVTIGSSGTGNNNAPRIGNNVFIGVGAKVLGQIDIGNNVKIGANAIVLSSIPENSIAVGKEAVIKQK